MRARISSLPPPALPGLCPLWLCLLWLCLLCLGALPPAAAREAAAERESAATEQSTVTEQSAVAEREAIAIINELHAALLRIMREAADLGYRGRYRIMEPVVANLFDSSMLARVVLSRHWREMDAATRADFSAVFRRLNTATYAARFDGYSGERFATRSATPARQGRILVKTELLRPQAEPVRLDYLLQRQRREEERPGMGASPQGDGGASPQGSGGVSPHGGGGWRIVNITANGVSDLSLKRAEYASVLKENGYNGLRERIVAQIRRMESDGAAGGDDAPPRQP